MATTGIGGGSESSIGSDVKALSIGGFRTEKELQSGAQGKVYKAVCMKVREGIAAEVGDVVALKVMVVQDDDQSIWRRLEKRTAELVRLQNENVVRYRGCFAEFGSFSNTYVVVQDYLDGETLKERLSRSAYGLDADVARSVVVQALKGLEYVSRCGMVHRDIKPGNIFICRDGTVKLIDFEIAHREGGTSTTGVAPGTYDYMAPDFLDGTFKGDVRSDVFSMGVVMHEIITGRKPYRKFSEDQAQANFVWATRWTHVQNPIHISARTERILDGSKEVIKRAISKDRSVRYSDFGEFLKAVDGIRSRYLLNVDGGRTYRLLQYIGHGGFGEVFKARCKETGELVAVKHLLKENYADRFRREAKIMKKLLNFKDECFARFLDFFTRSRSDGTSDAFLVMAYLDGMPGNSLRDAIRSVPPGGRLRETDVLRAFWRYAHGLDEMHRKGIYHRDIKPSNLYYPAGRPDEAKIMDLGIARDENGTITTDQVPGTLDYMPPEIPKQTSRGDSKMDIYALGLCFYEALTGKTGYPRLPPGKAGNLEFVKRVESGKPPVFDAFPVADNGELRVLICEMTDIDETKRISRASDVQDRIAKILRSMGDGAPAPISAPDQDPETDVTRPIDKPTDATVPVDLGGDAERPRPIYEPYWPEDRIVPIAKRRVSRICLGMGSAIAVLLSVGIAWHFAPQIKERFFGARPKLPAVQKPEYVPPKLPDPIPLGTIRFNVPDGLECRFEDKLMANMSTELRSQGQYKCIYSNLAKDEFGNSKFKPQSVTFEVAHTNKMNEVLPPATNSWTISDVSLEAQRNALGTQRDKELRRALEAQAALQRQLEEANSRLVQMEQAYSNEVVRLNKEREVEIKRAQDAVVQVKKEEEAKRKAAEENHAAAMAKQREQFEEAETEATNRLAVVAKASQVAENRRQELEDRLKTMGKANASEQEKIKAELAKATADASAAKKRRAEIEVQIAEVRRNNEEREKRLTEEFAEKSKAAEAAAAARIADAGKKAKADIEKAKSDADAAIKKAEEAAAREKATLSLQIGDMEKKVKEKDEAIRQLQNEIISLKQQMQDMRAIIDQQQKDEEERRQRMIAATNEIWKLVCQTEPVEGRMTRLREAEDKWFKALDCMDVSQRKPLYDAIAAARKEEQDKIDKTKKKEQDEERALAERKRREAMVDVTNRVWKLIGELTPVANRQERLSDADNICRGANQSNVLDKAVYDELFNAIYDRRNWVVGLIANKCRDKVVVAGRPIAPGASEIFTFTNGVVARPWEARRAGYDPLALPVMDFDGKEIKLQEKDFALGDVEITIPRIEDVTCYVDGEMQTRSIKRKPGVTLACTYRRNGFRDIEKKYEVLRVDAQSLPIPDNGEWMPAVNVDDIVTRANRRFAAEMWLEYMQIMFEAKNAGYTLNADDKKNVNTAYEKKSGSIDRQIDKVKKSTKLSGYKLEDLEKSKKEIIDLHEQLMGSGGAASP